MKALEVFAIYVTPFLVVGALAKLLLRRHAVDLNDVHDQAELRQRPRKVFLLGSWRVEK